MTLTAYLTFNGNCREAMTFYKDCLGGELSLQTIGESPLAGQLPEHMRCFILQATLTCNGFILQATDMVDEGGLKKGNGVSMLLNCSNEAEIRRCYARLAKEGVATYPLAPTYWGVLFGGLTDKFGNHWLLQTQPVAERPQV